MMRILKWAGIALGAIVVLLCLTAGALYMIGGAKFAGPGEVRAETVPAVSDSAALAWGAHLAVTHGCTSCHLETLEGQVLVDAPPFRLVASNLTHGRGGVADRMDAAGWERAIRHGIGADGRGLAIMPSEMYNHLADDEVAALIAWIESRPPVDNDLPATVIKPLGRIIAATGGFEPANSMVNQEAPHVATAPPPAATVEYGEYRSRALCGACHGMDMRGAQPPEPGAPFAPSLVNAGSWTLEQFRTALREGRSPSRELDGDYMPYEMIGRLTDAEIEGLWLYFRSLQ